MSWICNKCTRGFGTCRALMVHNSSCKGFFHYKQNTSETKQKINCVESPFKEKFCNDNNNGHENTNDNNSDHYNNIGQDVAIMVEEEYDFNDELLKQAEDHCLTGFATSKTIEPEYMSGIMLLSLLKKAKCPLYLFDDIVDWAQKSHVTYQIDFNSTKLSRKSCINMINMKYDLKGLQPQSTKIELKGSKQEITVVWHDFKQCLYSLLMDEQLMHPDNLLPYDAIGKEIDDINSGSVWKHAQKVYVKDKSREKLIPIIFFTDKTHTDIHGRLCLEPVQFTLGIFNRNTRNNPKAWRTIGYVTETIYTGKITTEMKQQDYHSILNIILKSYKECQNKPLKWIFKQEDKTKEYILKIPCLFIIGDTEGHDKLCGRMMNRQSIPYLCRYCNIHRDNVDDPFFESQNTKMSDIIKLVKKNDRVKLNEMSMHLVNNAWHDVQFCDTTHGLHGATLGELLHTLQQGIFEYTIKQLFNTKKQKKTKTKNITNKTKSNTKKKKTRYGRRIYSTRFH